MSLLRIIFFLLVFAPLHAQVKLDHEAVSFEGDNYFVFESQENKRLVIFLHGGVQNPYFDRPANEIDVEYLVEGNEHFLQQSSSHQFDLVIPIVDQDMNWLNQPEDVFKKISKFLYSAEKKYDEVFLAGFSDGGTGAYKIFYQHIDYFAGLIVFNGYPQHKNHYKSVDYSRVSGKKILFWGTFNDDTIPYEFLITEYHQQKIYNANTFLYVIDGEHRFDSYGKGDFVEVFDILTGEIKNTAFEPVHGFIRNDEVVHFYPYRKKIVRMYNYGADIYDLNKEQQKKWKK